MKKAICMLLSLCLICFVANYIYLNYGKWQYKVQPVNISGTLITKPMNITPFSLLDGYNNKFDDSRLLNKWSILFFGYTRCPDICPHTLTTLSNMYKQLEKTSDLPKKKLPNVIFISIDEEHDQNGFPDKYSKYFNKHFTGLSGSKAQTDLLTKSLGVVALKIEKSANSANPEQEKNYVYDHSGTLFIINPKGQLQAILSPPHKTDQLIKDYRAILNKYS